MSMRHNIDIDKRLREEEDDEDSSEDEGIIGQFVLDIEKGHPPHSRMDMNMNMDRLNMDMVIDPKSGVGSRGKRKKCQDLSTATKWAMIARYMDEMNRKSDRLYHGALDELVNEFGVSKRTVQRIVWEYKTQIQQGIRVPDLTNRKAGRNGDTKMTPEVMDNLRKLKAKMKTRMTVRGLADAYEIEYGTKISYMTLYRYDRKTTNPLKVPKDKPYREHDVQSAPPSMSSNSYGHMQQQGLINHNMMQMNNNSSNMNMNMDMNMNMNMNMNTQGGPTAPMHHNHNHHLNMNMSMNNPSMYMHMPHMPSSSSSSMNMNMQYVMPNQSMHPNATMNNHASLPIG